MGAYLYDEALVAKVKNWTENTDIHLYGPNEYRRLIEVIADETKDRPIELPILSISREDGYEILNPQKQPLTYDGLTLSAHKEKSLILNAIPISLKYKIDVLSRYEKEADAYMRNLIFNIINFPTLSITIPYNSDSAKDIVHNSFIRIVTDVANTSDQGRLSIGQFTRLTIGISIDDAYLWDTRVRDNISIEWEFIEN